MYMRAHTKAFSREGKHPKPISGGRKRRLIIYKCCKKNGKKKLAKQPYVFNTSVHLRFFLPSHPTNFVDGPLSDGGVLPLLYALFLTLESFPGDITSVFPNSRVKKSLTKRRRDPRDDIVRSQRGRERERPLIFSSALFFPRRRRTKMKKRQPRLTFFTRLSPGKPLPSERENKNRKSSELTAKCNRHFPRLLDLSLVFSLQNNYNCMSTKIFWKKYRSMRRFLSKPRGFHTHRISLQSKQKSYRRETDTYLTSQKNSVTMTHARIILDNPLPIFPSNRIINDSILGKFGRYKRLASFFCTCSLSEHQIHATPIFLLPNLNPESRPFRTRKIRCVRHSLICTVHN